MEYDARSDLSELQLHIFLTTFPRQGCVALVMPANPRCMHVPRDQTTNA
jgi:hypothetical protein